MMSKLKLHYHNFHFLPVTALFLLCIIIEWSCRSEIIKLKSSSLEVASNYSNESKQKGAHVFGHIDSINLQPLVNDNYSWITLVPFGSQLDFDSPKVNYFYGDTVDLLKLNSRWKDQIGIAHANGFKVFLKPHVWIDNPSNDKWRSDIFLNNDDDWDLWQESYSDFILNYAQIAQDNNVEMFCIGTEFTQLTKEKAAFWTSLIKKVRVLYTGKITYAANWYKEYENISFWKELDYIGVQAYFPLVNNSNPTIHQIEAGWGKYVKALHSLSKKYKRKILFTEMGYKSTANSATKPWEWVAYGSDSKFIASNETQANCYSAFFNKVWEEDWFAGVHIWQLRSDFHDDKYDFSLDFTPQGKPASIIIAREFK